MIEVLARRRLIGGFVLILLVTSGLLGVWAWGPNSTAGDVPGLVMAAENFPAPSEVSDLASTRCEECGVVESTRMVERRDENEGPYAMARPARIAEVTVRMSNGESHLFTDESRANWRPGERVIIIAGSAR